MLMPWISLLQTAADKRFKQELVDLQVGRGDILHLVDYPLPDYLDSHMWDVVISIISPGEVEKLDFYWQNQELYRCSHVRVFISHQVMYLPQYLHLYVLWSHKIKFSQLKEPKEASQKSPRFLQLLQQIWRLDWSDCLEVIASFSGNPRNNLAELTLPGSIHSNVLGDYWMWLSQV